MLYRMPYVFTAPVKLPRAKNHSVEDFGNHADLEVAETSSVEAPATVEWLDIDEFGNPAVKRTLRAFGGAFYAPVFDDSGQPVPAGGLRDSHIHDFMHDGPRPKQAFLRLREHGLPSRPEDFRDAMESTEEEVLAMLRENAARLLLVDGVLHEPFPVPVIRAVRESMRDRERIVLCACVRGGTAIARFNIQDHEESREWARSLKSGPWGEDLSVIDHMQIRVFRPDLLPSVDFFAKDLARQVHLQLTDAGKTLYMMDDGYIDAWQELRAAYTRLKEDAPGSIDDTMYAWKEMLARHDEVEEAKAARLGSQYNPDREKEHLMFALLNPRWESREIAVSPDDDARFGASWGR